MKYPRLATLSAIAAATLVIGATGTFAMCPDSNDVRAQYSPALAVGGSETRASTVGFGGASSSNRAGNDSQGMAGGYGAGESSLPGGNRWSDGMPMVW